jgi:hypothetical protein
MEMEPGTVDRLIDPRGSQKKVDFRQMDKGFANVEAARQLPNPQGWLAIK